MQKHFFFFLRLISYSPHVTEIEDFITLGINQKLQYMHTFYKILEEKLSYELI